MAFVVDLGIPFNENNQDEIMALSDEIEELLEDLDGLTSSGGSGFGYKDIQIKFQNGSKSQIEKIVKMKLREYGVIIGNNPDNQNEAYLSIYEEEDE